MALLDAILEHNSRWVEERQRPLSKLPRKKVAIFTCMDTRLLDFLEQALGLGRGDAMVIKNAGNTLVDPSSGGVIRSLVVAVYALGCEEILVIGHTDCGMAQVDEVALEAKMISRGVKPAAIAALHPDLREWLGAFHDPTGNVAQVVSHLRNNPLFPADVPVHGLMFDPTTGLLQPVVTGYPAGPQG